jgi:dienelactone hydrolase
MHRSIFKLVLSLCMVSVCTSIIHGYEPEDVSSTESTTDFNTSSDTKILNDLPSDQLTGLYEVGYRKVKIERTDGSTYEAWVFYPAQSTKRDEPILSSTDPYPALSFGHGFLQAAHRYKHTLRFIASHGYIVIATNSHRGFAPNHAQYSQDLAQCLEHLIALSQDESSWLSGCVDEDALALSGHSMGGGAAVIAAKLLDVQALLPLAGAPIRMSRTKTVVPTQPPAELHIVGSLDRIITPAASRTLMGRTEGPKLFATIEGGSHCGFMDETRIGCDKGTIGHQSQVRMTRSLMLAFLDLNLKGNVDMHQQVWVEHEDEARGLVTIDRVTYTDE